MKLTKHQEFLGGRSACVSCIIGRRRDHWQLDARRVARAWLQSARKLSIRCCMPRAQGLPQNQDRGRGPRGAPSLLGDLTTTRCAQGRTCMQLCRRAVRRAPGLRSWRCFSVSCSLRSVDQSPISDISVSRHQTPLARRPHLCRHYRPLPVPAGSGIEPGRHCSRALPGWIRWGSSCYVCTTAEQPTVE